MRYKVRSTKEDSQAILNSHFPDGKRMLVKAIQFRMTNLVVVDFGSERLNSVVFGSVMSLRCHNVYLAQVCLNLSPKARVSLRAVL